MKKLLLTGSKGYVGTNLMPFLKNYQVTEFDSFRSQGKWLDEFAEIADDFDVIVHAGALMQAGYDKPDLFWWNYETTCKLVDAYPDKHFIFFSSSMAVSPVNFYGWSKRCASDYVMVHSEMPCVVRPFTIYGNEENKIGRLSIVEQLVRGELPYIFHPCYRDFIHIEDICRAIVTIIEHQVTGLYDLGTGESTLMADVANWWRSPAPPVVTQTHPAWKNTTPTLLVADRTKLLSDYKPNIRIKDWIKNRWIFSI